LRSLFEYTPILVITLPPSTSPKMEHGGGLLQDLMALKKMMDVISEVYTDEGSSMLVVRKWLSKECSELSLSAKEALNAFNQRGEVITELLDRTNDAVTVACGLHNKQVSAFKQEEREVHKDIERLQALGSGTAITRGIRDTLLITRKILHVVAGIMQVYERFLIVPNYNISNDSKSLKLLSIECFGEPLQHMASVFTLICHCEDVEKVDMICGIMMYVLLEVSIGANADALDFAKGISNIFGDATEMGLSMRQAILSLWVLNNNPNPKDGVNYAIGSLSSISLQELFFGCIDGFHIVDILLENPVAASRYVSTTGASMVPLSTQQAVLLLTVELRIFVDWNTDKIEWVTQWNHLLFLQRRWGSGYEYLHSAFFNMFSFFVHNIEDYKTLKSIFAEVCLRSSFELAEQDVVESILLDMCSNEQLHGIPNDILITLYILKNRTYEAQSLHLKDYTSSDSPRIQSRDKVLRAQNELLSQGFSSSDRLSRITGCFLKTLHVAASRNAPHVPVRSQPHLHDEATSFFKTVKPDTIVETNSALEVVSNQPKVVPTQPKVHTTTKPRVIPVRRRKPMPMPGSVLKANNVVQEPSAVYSSPFVHSSPVVHSSPIVDSTPYVHSTPFVLSSPMVHSSTPTPMKRKPTPHSLISETPIPSKRDLSSVPPFAISTPSSVQAPASKLKQLTIKKTTKGGRLSAGQEDFIVGIPSPAPPNTYDDPQFTRVRRK